MATPNAQLRTAISALGRSKRRALVVALAARRDAHVGQDAAMAEFYAALASFVAKVADDETAVLRRLQTDLDETPPAA